MSRLLTSILAALALWQGAAARSQSPVGSLSLGAPFSDHLVLQSHEPVTIWGSAQPGVSVSIELGSQRGQAVTDRHGKWRISMPAMAPATGLVLSVSSGQERVALTDVAIGDVILCSGQSNMAFPMSAAALPDGERRSPLDSSLRLLTVPQGRAMVEQATFAKPAVWVRADEAIASFSAVCLIAGREMARKSRGRVGLINASLGSTPIEGWLPADGLARAGGFEPELRVLEAFIADPVAAEQRFGRTLQELWQDKPATPTNPGRSRMTYASLFNAMIAPLGAMRFTGAIWYQGEANARNADPRDAYVRKLNALLQSWRNRFGAGLPFAIVQIAPFGRLDDGTATHPAAEVREAQRLVAEQDPRAALVVTSDVGERIDIHPPLKKPVGVRAAAALMSITSGASSPAPGPRPIAARLQDRAIRIGIQGATGRLIAASWGRPGPFILCGKREGSCRHADARIIADEIEVQVPEDVEPALVRYCWGAAPICNVFDGSGLPLGPFELAVRARQ